MMDCFSPVCLLLLVLSHPGSGWQESWSSGAQTEHSQLHPAYSEFKAKDSSTLSKGGKLMIDTALSSGNLSILVGKQALLICHILNPGNESVSWIRHSDSGLLAVNDFVYTTSHRIKVFHDNESPDWKLSINPVEVSDHGLYECQVSTTPHTSHFIAMSVIEPKTIILGNRELFIEAGSTINLTCIIQADSMRDTHIYWNYNGKIIAYDRRRGGTIVIDKRPGGQTVTSLIITQADSSDSGTYICDPASSYSKSVIVHVTKGSDAAMMPNAIVTSASDKPPTSEITNLVLPATFSLFQLQHSKQLLRLL